ALTPLLALRERVAASYLNAGNAQAALDQYEKILADAKLPDYRASIGLQAANVLALMGRSTEAIKRYQQILDNYPQTLGGYRAMQALLKAGVQVDGLLRGQVSYAAEDYNDTIIALNDYTTNTPLVQINPSAFLLLGRAYRDAGNSSAALTTFQ